MPIIDQDPDTALADVMKEFAVFRIEIAEFVKVFLNILTGSDAPVPSTLDAAQLSKRCRRHSARKRRANKAIPMLASTTSHVCALSDPRSAASAIALALALANVNLYLMWDSLRCPYVSRLSQPHPVSYAPPLIIADRE